MADNHSTFLEFDNIIRLSSTKKTELRGSRQSIRDDISKYFKDNRDKHSASFKGQGSFPMNTTILPINNEYDVDDGVYIFGESEDRPSVQTAHDWIYDAVKDRTDQETLDKKTCIRVQYAAQYHVDLPIYYKTKKGKESTIDTEIPLLAHKTKGWVESDPYEFVKWFKEQSKGKPQLRRIIRYLKAWADYRNEKNKSLKFPNGLIFTILACNHFSANSRDDKSLLDTLKNIQAKIDDRSNYWARYECFRPTIDTNEDLLDSFSATTVKNNFLDELQKFIDSGNQAIEMESKKDSCAKWQKHLGDRFPCQNITEDSEKLAKSFSVQEIFKHDNKSA